MRLFGAKHTARLIMVGCFLSTVLLVRFCPQFLGVDNVWRRQQVSDSVDELTERIKRNPENAELFARLATKAQSGYRFERNRAIRAFGGLRELSKPALPVISDGLFHSDPYTRDSSARALMNMGKTALPAKDELILALEKYSNEGTGTWAAEALGNIGDSSPEVIDVLRITARTCLNPGTADRARKSYEKLTGVPLNKE